MRTAVVLLTIAALALVTSCKPASTPSAPVSKPTVDERQACSADDDCVAVELKCCDHCNGGTVVAAHKDFAAEVRQQAAGDCEGTMCTEMACLKQPTPVCQSGVCGLELDGNVTVTPLAN